MHLGKLCCKFLVLLLLVASYVMGCCDAAWRQLQKLCKCWVATLGTRVENSSIRASTWSITVFFSLSLSLCVVSLQTIKQAQKLYKCSGMPHASDSPSPSYHTYSCHSCAYPGQDMLGKPQTCFPQMKFIAESSCCVLCCVTQAKYACHMWQRGLCKLQLIV